MRKTTLIIFFCLLFFHSGAQNLSFSDSASISIITCSPGQEVYAKFGHSGIRVSDPVNNKDLIFNYGIFSFDTENFYYKFVKGETDYFLGVHPTDFFLPEYKNRNSMVWEQVLNLTVTEKRRIINALLENYKPENRMYRYNFVFDNCATRPRDKVLNSIDGHVMFHNTSEAKTFRQWVGVYVGNDSWVKFGIDLVFGMDADKSVSQYESMFLPEVLMNEFQMAQVVNMSTKETRNLVASKNVLVNVETEQLEEGSWMTKPLAIFLVVMLVVVLLSAFEINNKHYYKILDSTLLMVTGITGIIVFYLMFVSSHPLVKYNLNILWLNPLNVVAAILIWSKRFRIPMFIYQIVNIGLLILALIAFALSFQNFNVASFPLIVMILVRYSSWVVRTKHKLDRKSKFVIKNNITESSK